MSEAKGKGNWIEMMKVWLTVAAVVKRHFEAKLIRSFGMPSMQLLFLDF